MTSFHRRGSGAGGPGASSGMSASRRAAAGRPSLASSTSGLRSGSMSNGTAALYGASGRSKSVYQPRQASSRSPFGHHGLVGYGGSGSTGYLSSLASYGGTTSGYGGLVVPSSSKSNRSLSSGASLASSTSSFLAALLPSSVCAGTGVSSWSSSPSSRAAPAPGNSAGPSPSQSSKQRARHCRQRSRSTPRPARPAGPSSSYAADRLSRSGSSTSLAGSEGYASGGDRSGRSSRLSSTSSAAGDLAANSRTVTPARSENGEIDYKKLYEESLAENERLREKLKKTEEDLKGSKTLVENSVSGKSSMSELEKRERRAMERKLSEMEEELKQLQKLKMENERLRSENRALTRVVTKLTSSANARI